jgi:group I intron endonuclease
MDTAKPHGYIYHIRNPIDGKVYIGQTIQTLERRWYEHRNDSKRGTKHLYCAMRKHGLENFTFTELGCAYSQLELDDMENRAIWSHDSMDRKFGYNMKPGGAGCGPMCEDTKRKIGAANAISQLGLKRSEAAVAKVRAALLGRVRPAEETAKAAASNTGRKHTPEHREANRQARLGRKLTDEHKRNIGLAGVGRKASDEARKNMSLAQKGLGVGRKTSPEAKAKISAIHLGAKRTPETRARMSEAARKRWQKELTTPED